jgi:hypothetical protein
MKKILLLAVAALASLGAFAQNYEHSAGVVVGNLNGLSYKHFISNELAIQADLGFGIVSTSGTLVGANKETYKEDNYKSSNKTKYQSTGDLWSFQIAPNFIWQKNIASMDWANLDFFVGGGISLGYAKLTNLKVKKGETISNINGNETKTELKEKSFEDQEKSDWDNFYEKAYGKFGINAIAGVEFAFTGAPITVGVDFRPGYGLLFSGDINKDNKEYAKKFKEAGGSYKESTTYNFFDWTLAATVRYTF